MGEKEFNKLKNKEGATGIDALVAKFFDEGRVIETESGNSHYDPEDKTITMNTAPDMQGVDLEFFHESFHGARKSGYSHKSIYKAMAKVDGVNFKQFSKDREKQLKEQKSPSTDKDSAMYGSAINSWINKHCG